MSTEPEPKYKKYVKGYYFLSFAKRFVDKYGKKLMDTAKHCSRCCKNCFKKNSSKNFRSNWRFNQK